MTYFYNSAPSTLDFLLRGVVMVAISYGIVFIGALVVNTLRVPWLLDAESGEQINALEKRAQTAEVSVRVFEDQAEQSEATKRENKRLHTLFGELMAEGEALANELRRDHHQNYGAWLQKRLKWREKVSQSLIDMGLSTEAATFRHAGEKDPRVVAPGTVSDPRYWFDFYIGELDGYRTKLQEIVARRLP